MNLSPEVFDSIIQMLKDYKSEDYLSRNYKFVSRDPIGEGGFGKVYKVQKKQPNMWEHHQNFALKKIEICYEGNYSDHSVSNTSKTDEDNIWDFIQSCQEAVLQSKVFEHPNILAVYDSWIQQPSKKPEHQSYATDIRTIIKFLQSGSKQAGVNVLKISEEVRKALMNIEGLCVYLIMDLYDFSLKTWLLQEEQKPKENRDYLAKDDIVSQLIKALDYVHTDKKYCHLDLTPANILLRKEHSGIVAAIADFGLSQFYQPSVQLPIESRPGKPPYNQAPDKYYTLPFDIWSLGLIVYEIYCESSPTSAELIELCSAATEDDTALINFLNLATNVNKNGRFYRIVSHCLSVADRPTADYLLLHYVYTQIVRDKDSSRLKTADSDDDTVSNQSMKSSITSGQLSCLKTTRKSRRYRSIQDQSTLAAQKLNSAGEFAEGHSLVQPSPSSASDKVSAKSSDTLSTASSFLITTKQKDFANQSSYSPQQKSKSKSKSASKHLNPSHVWGKVKEKLGFHKPDVAKRDGEVSSDD